MVVVDIVRVARAVVAPPLPPMVLVVVSFGSWHCMLLRWTSVWNAF